MSSMFDKTIQGLQTSINMRELKQGVIQSNIANAETPGYHAKKVDFEDALARALDLDGTKTLETSSPEHFAAGGGLSVTKVAPDVYENPEGAVNNDGNTVDLGREIADLNANSIMHKAAIQLINKKLAALKYAVSDGGR